MLRAVFSPAINMLVCMYIETQIFTATARSADVGEMSDSIDAALSGEDLDINFHIGCSRH